MRSSVARIRWVAVFALLLLAVSAVPVLAEPPPANPGVVLPPTPEDFDPGKLPDGKDVAEAIQEAEEEEAQRKQWLATPQAAQEREASLLAYADISAAEAEALLGSSFAEQFANLNADPARFLSDAQLISPAEDPTAATVKDKGNGMVLDAAISLRTRNEEGSLAKVDLSLKASPDGFETTNGLVDVSIPDSATEPVEIGDEGLGISQQGPVADHEARLFGDENVFIPEVLTDTDLLISPTAGGVEVFNQLRSRHSPETLRFEIDVPDGAELRANGDWGAKVVRGDEVLAFVPEPIAVDAQGTDVPVDLQVDGNSLLLNVNHRQGDYAMPILVDPWVLENNENWIYGQNHDALDMGVWTYNNEGSWWFYGSTKCIYECFGPGGKGTRGLYVSLEGQRSYGANQFGQWSYTAPNIYSYVTSVTLGAPYVRADHGCSSPPYGQPHDYFGIWNGGWVYRSVGSANYPGGTYTLPFDGQSAVFGLGTGGGIPWIPCWRDLYAGGAHVWLDDDYWPSVYSVTDPPTKWINSTEPVKVVAQASDAGLGIKEVNLNSEGSSAVPDIPVQNQCAGTRRSPCLTGHTATFNLTGAHFREGRRPGHVVAVDATGKTSNPYYFETKMDASAPEVTLDGQLAEATEEDEGPNKGGAEVEKLRLPVYSLKVVATDGSNDNDINKRSGVKDIEIWLNGVEQEVPWSPASSCASSCPMTQAYQLKLSKLSTSGKHSLEVKVKDFVNNVRIRDIEFEYFPATGMKDEYVMHYFPLPDGQGNEAEEEHPDRPELAVNVMNGNLVYRETDIDIESAAGLDLEVERYYNSMLPENENTEWGDGWTLAQTPELDPVKIGGSPVPNQAEVLDSSGAIDDDVSLPTAAGASKFDPSLQATLTKKDSGGYELADETGEVPGSISFDATGQAEALVSEGSAKVDYDYEGGELAEIEVSDPATFAADPAELEIPEPELVTAPTYESSFGSSGTSNGQLKRPGDVARDAAGNIWVVEQGNNRVQKFSASGAYLSKFGSAGSGNGQFKRPTAIAIDLSGNLWVADSENHRVQKFNDKGEFLAKYGSFGSGNGQFKYPEGIAVDAKGSIWVSDTENGRLQKLTAAGAFVKAVGSKGSGAGQLGLPAALDVAPGGEVFVADWEHNRVSVFSEEGSFVRQFGSKGTNDGQFMSPDSLDVDTQGDVWVGDESDYIQRFSSTGAYIEGFGASGSGPGQFSFSYAMGLTADEGSLWVADVDNHRVQKWLVPRERPIYHSAFGANGAGDGQLKSPGDIAIGIEGSLWVADRANNRLQKFDPSGKFLAKVGSGGSGDGQFNRPTAVAVDRDGNLLVADSNNNRVQKLSPEGAFLSKFGSLGTGSGKFLSPEGVATDFGGNIWVADSLNGRLQKFNEAGEFLKVAGSKGSGTGQLGKPLGLDVDPEGNVWVADWENNRVSVFDKEGGFILQFGSAGSGPGQFNRPTEIEIDGRGNVWVGDQNNSRVQRFTLAAQHVGQFGSAGSGAGQLSLAAPMGIAATRSGSIWLTDVNNHRIQKWKLGNYVISPAPDPDLSDGDPSVEIETPGGLVSSVEGNAAGEHSYTHSGDDLTSHIGPNGEIKYQYDAVGRMTKVTLPNGTWGSIAYLSDGRVKSVTVDPAGSPPAKKTEFEYQDEPTRRTTVVPADAPHLVYEIGVDGSVLKWWNKLKAPTIEPLIGSLYANRETSQPISAGDYYLTARAWSAEGIASIDIIVNGNQLVDEMNCEQDPEKPGLECVTPAPVNEWVTETGEHAPGILHVEVLATDRIGNSSAERFWVNIPQTPPPPANGVVPPKFKDIKKFREEYGLEVVFPVANEIQLNERIFNLIGAWHNPHSPAGQVARASWERWGVPLRPEDVAELEYREWFYNLNAERIDQWVEIAKPSSFAGYYIDHPAGGIMRIGFIDSQDERLQSLKTSLPLADDGRLQIYPSTPPTSYLSVQDASQAVSSAIESNSTLNELVVSVKDDEAGKTVYVGTPAVTQVEGILEQTVGPSAPVTVEYDAGGGGPLSGRFRNHGRMRAGDFIVSRYYSYPEGIPVHVGNRDCTAGFGAKSKADNVRGSIIWHFFVLTAGHCTGPEVYAKQVFRSTDADPLNEKHWKKVGSVARDAYTNVTSRARTDAEAIRVYGSDIVPQGVFGWNGGLIPTEQAGKARIGNILCFSGAKSQVPQCGPIVARSTYWKGSDGVARGGYWVKFKKPATHGDSGAPVWSRASGSPSIGLVTAGRPPGSFTETLVEPLLHPYKMPSNVVPGVLHDPSLQPLSLKHR